MTNARWALDYVQAKVGAIDSQHIYCAGHSSAGTWSLLLAEREPPIQACIAFAPVTDLPKRLAPMMQEMKRTIPTFNDFVTNSSPMTHAAALKCPLFLFHAEDDSTVSITESTQFADAAKKTNSQVTFIRVATGNHYDSMIRQGIPQAIDWLKKMQK